ncbi:MAG: hypothetical protein OEY14_17430, partial [Myxococcales bacterium]|nr:hypothetical protein [Myxococcales bacterium]
MARELHQLETQILARLPQSAARAPWREVVEIAPEPALVRRICAEGSRPVCWVLADKRAGMRYRRLDRFDRESVEEALLEWARGIGNAWRPASVPEPDLEGRAERWQEAAPSAALTLLSEGLEALRVLHEPEAPFEVPALAVWVDPQALELRAEIASAQPEQNPTTLKIALAEQEEEGGLRVSPENAPSPWIAALAAWGRDAIHDPAHPLHAELRSVAITPRWLRLLDALGEHLPPAEISPERPPERLAWRVGMSERGQLEIEPALQKRGKRGWTHGRAVEPAQIATLAVADELDRRVVRRWREASDDASTPGAGVGEALLALVGHPRVVCSPGGGAALRVREVAVSARVEGSGRRRVLFTVGGDVVEAEELVPWLMPPHHLVRLNEPRREVLVATVSDSFAKIVRTVAEWDAAIPMSADETLLALLLRLPAEIGLELPSDLGGPMQPADGRIYIQLEPLPHGGARVRFSIRPLGDARRYSPGAGPAHLVGARDGIRVRTSRQLPLERVEAERWVERLGLSRARSESPHCFLLDEPEEAIELVRRLSEPDEALVVEWPADELPWQIHEGVGQLATRVRHANEWFEVDGELHIDEHRVELAALLAAAREGRRYVALGGGHFARIDDALRSQLDAAEDLLVERGGALVAGAEAALALDRALGATLERDRAWETLLG